MFGAQDKFVDYIHHVESKCERAVNLLIYVVDAKQEERIRGKEQVQIEIDALSGPAGAIFHAQERKEKDGKSQKDVLRALEIKKQKELKAQVARVLDAEIRSTINQYNR